ncbi:MAG: hypothetical protein AAFU85_15520 [Planctomycetota bacterium]
MIGRLAIYDHGSTLGFEVGDQTVSATSFHPNHPIRRELSKLKGKFAKGGYIYLGNCYSGQATQTLKELAKLLGVTVYANTGAVRPALNVAHGSLVKVDPNETVKVYGKPATKKKK